MPIALVLAMMLYQAAPAEAATASQSAEAPAEASAAPNDIDAASAASNLPKDDYGLVAWCHGALAAQLELDPIAHADMISIEGKAKVAARAKSDAEMEKDRREYLHEYERALAAAEKASPTAIHQYGVESEVSGYKLWGATRQKQPIWRMLDWGMWDPNDAGCGDAAKRLYNRATLFGEALKGAPDDKADPTPATEKVEPKPYLDADSGAKTGGDARPPAQAVSAAGGAETTGPVTADAAATSEVAQTPVVEAVAPVSKPAIKTARAKTVAAKARTTRVAASAPPAAPVEPPATTVETPPADALSTPPPATAVAPVEPAPLRGPQI